MASRATLLGELKQELGIGLLMLPYPPPFSRKDVTDHALDVETRQRLGRQEIAKGEFQTIRAWLAKRNWQLSWQRLPNHAHPGETVCHLYLAPMTRTSLEIGYHASRRASLNSILADGLLPGSPERQTDADRLDCEGNIYVCENLGTPADAGKSESYSAHWWRDHFSKHNRFNDPDWVILEVNLGETPSHHQYRDIWSDSGVIIDGIDRIPPALIRQVFPLP